MLAPLIFAVAAAVLPPTPPVIGLHVPWAVGGPRIEPDGTLVERQPEWPPFRVAAVRLWDTRTAWLNLEPSEGAFDWSTLDQHVAQARANGTLDVTLVLWGTPRWAATSESPQDAPWLGPGSASPPEDLSSWTRYVSRVAARYRGAITAYELGNEVNDPAFWRGDDQQLTRATAAASTAIKRADPAATLVSPSFAVSSATPQEVARLEAAWSLWASNGIDLDALAVHWYPARGSGGAGLEDTLRRLRAAARRSGWATTPIWITEAALREPGASPGRMTVLMRRATRTLQHMPNSARIDRLYWYAWTDAPIGDVTPLPPRLDPASLLTRPERAAALRSPALR